MAVLFVDGFDHYGASDAEWVRKWDNIRSGGFVTSGTTNSRRTGGRHCVLTGHASLWGFLHKQFPSNQATFAAGFAFYVDSAMDSHKGFIFWDYPNAQVSVYLEDDGSIAVYRSYKDGTPVLVETGAQTGASIWSVNTWHYIEMKFTIDNTSGVYQVDLDGVTVLEGSGVDTQVSGNAYCDYMSVRGMNGSSPEDVYVDDLYIDDTDMLGDCRVDTLWPSADGTTNDFTPSSGSDNYLMVDDEYDVDDDTTYNAETTGNSYDYYEYDDLDPLESPGSSDEATIHCVAHNLHMRDTADGSDAVYFVTRTGGVGLGNPTPGAQDPSSSYSNFQWPMLVDEYDDAAWTEALVNSMEAGAWVLTVADEIRLTQCVLEVLRENGDVAGTFGVTTVIINCG